VVTKAEEELQRAIESGSFETAMPLIEKYGEAVLSELRKAGDAKERSAIASDASAFLQDRLHLARVMRSHIAAQIGAASRIASYASVPGVINTWHIEG